MRLDNLYPELKYNYIIRELENTPYSERAEEAIKLLKAFNKSVMDYIPDARVGVGYGGLPEKEKFEDHVRYAKDFFQYILNLDLPPDGRKWVEEHFVRRLEEDEKKSRWLYEKSEFKESREFKLPCEFKLPYDRLRELPHHQLPPYIYDWRGSILGAEDRFVEEGLRDLTFTQKILGRGGYAWVYLMLGPDGEKYALKLFHQPWKFRTEGRPFSRYTRRVANERIIENVKEIQDLLSEFPKFPKIKAFSPDNKMYGANDSWYIMDFVDGKPVKRRLFDKGGLSAKSEADDYLKKSVIEEYAKMLRFLHSRDFVFYDNNWGALMLSDDNKEFGFIDFDLITKVGEEPAVIAYVYVYASEDQLRKDSELPTKSGDLESFAKMIDHLYVGSPFIENRDALARFKKDPEYPHNRKEKLPESLDDLVEQILIAPKNCDITIDDFCRAIESI